MSPGVVDALVLAGGTARRLGGVSKADVVLHGRRLLDHVLDATAGARRTVVVAPETVAVPAGVVRTNEDPPRGGPVAGIAAGLAALSAGGPAAPVVLLLSCDAPGVAPAVPRLLATLAEHPDVDGAGLEDRTGHLQWLLAAYRTGPLTARLTGLGSGGALRHVSVRALVEPLRLLGVPAQGHEADDVDTWTDLERLGGDAPSDRLAGDADPG